MLLFCFPNRTFSNPERRSELIARGGRQLTKLSFPPSLAPEPRPWLPPIAHLWASPLIPGWSWGPRRWGTQERPLSRLSPREAHLPPAVVCPLWAPEGPAFPAHSAPIGRCGYSPAACPVPGTAVGMKFWARGLQTMALGLHQPAAGCLGESGFIGT